MATQQLSKSRTTAIRERICVVATNIDYEQFCRESLKRLPAQWKSRIRLLSVMGSQLPALASKGIKATLVVSRLSDLTPDLEKFLVGSMSRQLLFLDELPVEAVASRLLRLNIRDPHRLHIASRPSSIRDILFRFLRGIAHGDGPDAIADAWVEGQEVVLISPAFERLAIPFEKLKRLLGNDQSKYGTFEIDEDGRFLFWPHADVHLGWKQLLQLVNPTTVLADLKKTKDFDKRYGAAIRSVRDESKLKQSDIRGVTERHLRRVEHGEYPASKSTLEALAAAHGLPLEDYLARLAKRLGKTD